MATYKFEHFNAELINPIIDSITTVYTKGGLTLEVRGVLNANGNKLFGVDFGIMDNSTDWTDANIESFALIELENYLVS